VTDYRNWTNEQLNAEILKRLPDTAYRFLTMASGEGRSTKLTNLDLCTRSDFADNPESTSYLINSYIPRLLPDQIIEWWHLHDRLYGFPKRELEGDPRKNCVLFLTWLDEHP